jgi:hypothetical protein
VSFAAHLTPQIMAAEAGRGPRRKRIEGDWAFFATSMT